VRELCGVNGQPASQGNLGSVAALFSLETHLAEIKDKGKILHGTALFSLKKEKSDDPPNSEWA
jgi:hypothetical protein